jgi:hypothetical protein
VVLNYRGASTKRVLSCFRKVEVVSNGDVPKTVGFNEFSSVSADSDRMTLFEVTSRVRLIVVGRIC